MKEHDIEAIKAALESLKQELELLNLWGGESKRPQEEAFLDSSPFCLERMEFHQWLEYVLIERLSLLIFKEEELPKKMLTHTYAQELYHGSWHKYRGLISALQRLDKLISIEE